MIFYKWIESTIYPIDQAYPEADWIIGNHADELTLWMPIIATRSHCSCKFLVLPCCFHTLNGDRGVEFDPQLGRYESYLQQVEDMTRFCGFQPEREYLRIPSTKNIAIIGRTRALSMKQDDRENRVNELLAGVTFTPRKSDKEKNDIRMLKKKNHTCGTEKSEGLAN